MGCDQLIDVSAKKHTKLQAESTTTYAASQFRRLKRDASYTEYESIHKSGAEEIPWAVEMERRFATANTDHFITYFGDRSQKDYTWNTESFFGDRYILTMQVQVIIDYSNRRIKLTGLPTFNLVEVVSANPNGSDAIGRTVQFDDKQFRALVRSGWDFNSIGFDTRRPPVNGFDLVQAMTQAPRYPISLTQ